MGRQIKLPGFNEVDRLLKAIRLLEANGYVVKKGRNTGGK